MMKWAPLHLHTHYSALDGLSQPDKLAVRLEEYGYTACAVSDHGNISGFPSFAKENKAHGVKSIAGCEFYIADYDSQQKEKANGNSHLVVLAKNYQGWLSLVRAVSESNHPDNFYRRPRLDLDRLAAHCNGNLLSFSGHPGSNLCKVIMDPGCYSARSVSEAAHFLLPNAEEDACRLALRMQDIFGKGNFFIEIQLIDKDRLHMSVVLAEVLRNVAKKTGIPCVATADSHYINREDAVDQRVLLCSALRTTLGAVSAKMASDEGFALSGFFESDNYHLPMQDEMLRLHRGYEQELNNSLLIAEQCEAYDITSKPRLPQFTCPNGMGEIEYLKSLCREGWKSRLKDILNSDNRVLYSERVLKELKVIEEAGLQGYFLIVQDYVNWAKQSMLVGPGRGSGAGCLLSYLLRITEIDPVEYDLLFERFYNAGRNTKDNVAFPDIDTDFPVERRADVIDYLKKKYGEKNVCQIATFGRLMGRGALKEVLRVHGACSQDIMNQITKAIPAEAEINDELEQMEQEDGTSSIIKWTLKEEPDRVAEWVRMDKAGNITGDFAEYFKQAIRLEGTIKSTGKHASGIIIANEAIENICPVEYDKKSGDLYAAMEMGDLERIGLLKFDVLGVSMLSKLEGVKNLLSHGKVDII
jgi:DNA polymerase-3 subunit alpha